MPLFFFDTDDFNEVERQSIRDGDGIECESQEAARRLAIATLTQMATVELSEGNRHVFSVKVRDASRMPIYYGSLSLVAEWLNDPA